MGLYYDGHSGTYLYYNERTKSYEYHSQAAMPASQSASNQVMCEDIPSESGSSSPEALREDTAGDIKTKSVIVPVEKPDPLEAKENDLNTPGSNPMAPVLVESSSRKESKHEKKSSHESKRDHKRKGKHKKHKVKKDFQWLGIVKIGFFQEIIKRKYLEVDNLI